MAVLRKLSRGQREKKLEGGGVGSMQGEMLLKTFHLRENTERKKQRKRRDREGYRERKETVAGKKIASSFQYFIFFCHYKLQLPTYRLPDNNYPPTTHYTVP